MNAILLLIPISLLLIVLAIWAFFWAVDHAQFDALERASLVPLERDDAESTPPPAHTRDD